MALGVAAGRPQAPFRGVQCETWALGPCSFIYLLSFHFMLKGFLEQQVFFLILRCNAVFTNRCWAHVLHGGGDTCSPISCLCKYPWRASPSKFRQDQPSSAPCALAHCLLSGAPRACLWSCLRGAVTLPHLEWCGGDGRLAWVGGRDPVPCFSSPAVS